MTDLELNLAVARHVFGFEPVEVFSTSTGRHRWRVPGAPGELLRPYATTGDGMLSVAEAMHKRGHGLQLDQTRKSGLWYARFYDLKDRLYSAISISAVCDPSAPRAVAIAALRALGAWGACVSRASRGARIYKRRPRRSAKDAGHGGSFTST